MKQPKLTSMCITMKVANDPVVCEYLRYMGVVSICGGTHTATVPQTVLAQLANPSRPRTFVLHEPEDAVLATVSVPRGYEPTVWAKQNIERLASFGVSAVAWTGEIGKAIVIHDVTYSHR